MGGFSNRELANCAKREIRQRIRVYERLIAEGKMSRHKADEEIAMMEQIADDYDAKAEADDRRDRLI